MKLRGNLVHSGVCKYKPLGPAAFLFAALLLCMAAPAPAQSKKDEEKRISSLLATLDTSLDGDKVPAEWRVVIITGRRDWAKLRASFKTDADIVFNYLAGKWST